MAPEVLTGNYSTQADVWSVGVIAYMLLSSQMPFYGRKRRHIVDQIMRCQYDFKGRRWKRLSEEAKAFIEDLLVANPNDRATANEALCHVWLDKGIGSTVRGPTAAELDLANNNIKKFASYSKLKKLALMVVAHKSTSEEIGILRKVFQKYDSRGDGYIRFTDFKKALKPYGLSTAEMREMFDGVDQDGTGKIRYTEFLAATIEAQGAIDEMRLAEAFDRLDSDDSGYISASNLQELLGDEFPKDEIAKIIREADLTQDNRISYPEFLALWENKQESHIEQLYDSIQPQPTTNPQPTNGYTVLSPSPRTVERKRAMREESEAESSTLARANFIEGKKLSERRSGRLAKIDQEEAKKLVFAESADIIPDVVLYSPGRDLDFSAKVNGDVPPPPPPPPLPPAAGTSRQ
uniref:Calmodulin n=1 Tax=Cyclophora tenuis TaxID=216820 RepID=A0A7S1GID9_CYCTE